jgi:hypothetical protein
MASVMAGSYPGPGTTLGPAIVFAYRAAIHAKTQKPAVQNEPSNEQGRDRAMSD